MCRGRRVGAAEAPPDDSVVRIHSRGSKKVGIPIRIRQRDRGVPAAVARGPSDAGELGEDFCSGMAAAPDGVHCEEEPAC